MAIRVECKCGKTISAKDELAGKRVKCPQCGNVIAIPDAGHPTQPAAITAKCDCGKEMRAPAKLAGRRVRCPSCQSPVQLPRIPSSTNPSNPADATNQSSNAKSSQQGGVPEPDDTDFGFGEDLSGERRLDSLHDEGIDNDISGMAGLLDDLGLEPSKTGTRCPNCKTDMNEDAILCIECGFNIETGKTLKRSSFVKEKKTDAGIGSPKKKERKGLLGKFKKG